MSALCSWLDNYVEGRSFSHLNITFYGGEPLLNMSSLIAVADHVKALCIRHKAELSSYLISNGSLLTLKVLEQLRSYNLRQVQITIDGAAELHNTTRPFCDGSPSYDSIKANLAQTLKVCPVVIRMNMNVATMHHAFGLIDDLSDSGLLQKDNVFLEIAHIMDCGCDKSPTMMSPEFIVARYSCLRYAVDKGFGLRNPLKLAPCHARTPGCFSFLPDGRIFNCFLLVDRPECLLGNVNERSFAGVYYELVTQTTHDESCIDCKFFPTCMGGCRAAALKCNGALSDKMCDLSHFEDMVVPDLVLHFDQMKTTC